MSFRIGDPKKEKTLESCVVCGAADVVEQVSAVGERSYCRRCFHGRRNKVDAFPYDQTPMCPLGTGEARLQSQIRFFGPWIKPGARVLEIGCATGELAGAVRRALPIARYEAIELSPAGDLARPVVDRLHTLPLPQLIAAGEIESKFDAVLMSHVLEHLEDPRAEIGAIESVLAADGVFFVEVPNASGNRLLPIDDNRSHLHFFSPTSLLWMLADAGLNAVATATGVRLDARYADSLQVLARPFSAPKWEPTLLSDHPSLRASADIVVWGAGSLADELLANFFDPRMIDFFIDRDPKKIGGARLGRPIRGPDALGGEARTILVNSIDFAPSIMADIRAHSSGVDHRLVPIGDLLGG